MESRKLTRRQAYEKKMLIVKKTNKKNAQFKLKEVKDI